MRQLKSQDLAAISGGFDPLSIIIAGAIFSVLSDSSYNDGEEYYNYPQPVVYYSHPVYDSWGNYLGESYPNYD